MKVLVIGAGVVGTTTAWYLSEAGHEVTVVDRQPGAGQETSFANGGQISVSHAEPWANPGAIRKIFGWLGKEDAPLLFRWRLDPEMFRWGFQFLRECSPSRTRINIRAIVALASYSRQSLIELRTKTGLTYDELSRGILHFYTDQREFEGAAMAAEVMRDFGLERRQIDAAECVDIEPALADARSMIVGGHYTPSDESGDAHLFTRRLAELATERGVRFEYGTPIVRLRSSAGQVQYAERYNGERMAADAYVVACGSFSNALLNPLGIRLPVYPAKGYSATLTLAEGENFAPSVSLTDDGHKLVFSRLGNRLRIAGTAEMNGYGMGLNQVRCEAITTRTHEIFPHLQTVGDPVYWTGLRPATPSNVPIVGATRLQNLFLNTGHGTLGWTMSCGSSRALADIISGQRPEVDFPFTYRY
jgi:D-amino-acid dehydrogenase